MFRNSCRASFVWFISEPQKEKSLQWVGISHPGIWFRICGSSRANNTVVPRNAGVVAAGYRFFSDFMSESKMNTEGIKSGNTDMSRERIIGPPSSMLSGLPSPEAMANCSAWMRVALV